jgi:2-dehydro-3-deoxyglucarate aldolase/4-hydroxy-2-oxoheptanedioate aldolase
MNNLKSKILNNEKVFGTQIMMCDTAIGDIFSSLKYDFLWVDTEHSSIGYKQLLDYISLCEAKGTPTLIRLHIDEYNHTKRVLEMGPAGVVFPMINTREQAQKAIDSTYYPLKGTRGCGAMRFGRYGLDSLDAVIAKQDEMIRCIQLETKEAIDNLEEIVKVEGIDCFIFGLWDLSFDIGKPGDVLCEEELTYVKKAIDILKKNRKAIGIATGNTDKDFLQKWADMGITFITSGSDFDYLRMGAVNTLNSLKEIK